MTHENRASTDTARREMPAPIRYLFTYVINPIMTVLLRSRFHGRVSKHLILLTFTGRKSGKQFTTPVGYNRAGDTLYVVTESPWWNNLRGDAPVTVLLEGQERRGRAEAFPDPERVARTIQRDIEEHGIDYAQQRCRLDLDSPQPRFEELVEKSRGKVLIEIQLAEKSTESTQ